MSPEEKTKEPGPMSMRPTPKVSAFAKRLGKMWKSTARIATHVYAVKAARNVVTYLHAHFVSSSFTLD
jgi:hypothetical protein